ncbi:MAG: tRNA(Ile)-lysidine synthase [Cryptosporangiaceae bacterium]|nr:tRNA(Ile)-lysidine synthase [Cryptosporangiaceae bacterium]
MAGPAPEVAAVRAAVRRALADLPAAALVLVACSGGADSLALAAATSFVAPRYGLVPGLLTVDHDLQDGSAERAADVADWAGELFGQVEILRVHVGTAGGPEAAARSARYEALGAAADRLGAAAVLLGHTEDDQAETVLLALARGSGARSLAGMAAVRGVYRRPLLELPRAVVRAAAEGLPVWEDPHNTDPRFARSRVRALLPALTEAAGPGAIAGLARSARQLRADADLLTALAAEVLVKATVDGELEVAVLAAEPAALRTRALHAWALELGSPGGALSSRHVTALDALVTGWRGQGPAYLPSGIVVERSGGRLRRA